MRSGDAVHGVACHIHRMAISYTLHRPFHSFHGQQMSAAPKRKSRDATVAQHNATKKHLVAGRGDLALLLVFVLFVTLRFLVAFIDAQALRLWGMDMFAYPPMGWELMVALAAQPGPSRLPKSCQPITAPSGSPSTASYSSLWRIITPWSRR